LILLIDNFDSFTHNLQDYLEQQGIDVLTVRYNELGDHWDSLKRAEGIVISPGPGRPADYPALFEIIGAYEGQKPILGVCLGHQTLCCYYGGKLVKAHKPMHGKVSMVSHTGTDLYTGVQSPTQVTRYHSLIISHLPNMLKATGTTEMGELMSFAHKEKPVWGVQYHPEAVLTNSGLKIIENFVSFVRNRTGESVKAKGKVEVVKDLPKNEICW